MSSNPELNPEEKRLILKLREIFAEEKQPDVLAIVIRSEKGYGIGKMTNKGFIEFVTNPWNRQRL